MACDIRDVANVIGAPKISQLMFVIIETLTLDQVYKYHAVILDLTRGALQDLPIFKQRHGR